MLVIMRCFGTILWLHLCVQTNLEILAFLSVRVAHVSLQFTCVEETLRAGCKLAPGENEVQVKARVFVMCSNSTDVTRKLT